MTLSEFIKKHNGKGMDYDSIAGVQCVDLIKYYLKEVYNISPGSWGDARIYYEMFNNTSWGGYKAMNASGAFTRIANTPSFVPKAGDIVVWGKNISSSHNSGHIAIADGTGNTQYFYSYDQNWGSDRSCHRVRHTYTAFLGVLRPNVRTTKADLNVRSGAGVLNKKVDELKAGTKVIVYETKGSWSRIGEGKWVSSNYLVL